MYVVSLYLEHSSHLTMYNVIFILTDIRSPVIRWRRREGRLPPGHSVRNGILTLPQFRSEYGGEYICSTVTQTQSFESSVFIIVTGKKGCQYLDIPLVSCLYNYW